MKTVLTLSAATVAALLILAACAGPTAPDPSPNPSPDPSPSPVVVKHGLPLDFESAGVSTDFSLNAGYQNSATLAALALDTSNNGSISAGGRNYFEAGSGTKTWPDAVELGAQTLKFTLRTEGSDGDNTHVVLSFKNLDFGSMTAKTGLEFSMMLPNGPNSIGLSPIIRYNDGLGSTDSENAAVFTAPLNDPTAEDFTNASSVYDWTYFGDHVFLHFKVPFDCFSVPGWAPAAAKIHTTIADALAAGTAFNQIDFDFRFATNDANGGAFATDYDSYVDNVTLY